MNPITVTSPLLPVLEEFDELLKDVWDRKRITNNGYYHKKPESALGEHLCVKYISLRETMKMVVFIHHK